MKRVFKRAKHFAGFEDRGELPIESIEIQDHELNKYLNDNYELFDGTLSDYENMVMECIQKCEANIVK